MRQTKWLAAFVAGAVLFTGGWLTAQTGLGSDQFDDVPAGTWYDRPVGWAVENGITSGVSPTEFDPNETLTRAEMVTFLYRYHLYVAEGVPPSPTTTTTTTTTEPPARTGTGRLSGITIQPEACAGYSRGHYRPHGTSWRALGTVGYLTNERLTSGDVDHVVALEEAWCSGIRDAAFGADPANHRASKSAVNRGKGGRDPLEWWNTGGSTTPRTVDYPGWCNYLDIHVTVKSEWGGSMDQAEYDFVESELGQCGSVSPPPPPEGR